MYWITQSLSLLSITDLYDTGLWTVVILLKDYTLLLQGVGLMPINDNSKWQNPKAIKSSKKIKLYNKVATSPIYAVLGK